MLRIKKEFILTDEEIIFLDSLPDNLPSTHLTKKTKDKINSIYDKYLTRKVYKSWSTELWEIEKKENWPSGNRVKEVEAKRMILSWLCREIQYHNNKTGDKAIQHLLCQLETRTSNQILIAKIYEVVKEEQEPANV